MKLVKFLSIAALALGLFACDKQDLPYEMPSEGVAIDIVKASGTDEMLPDGDNTGDYAVVLTIPKQQGDYSFMEKAQLLCVFTPYGGKARSVVVEDNITTFPHTANFTLSDVSSKLGITAPTLGDKMEFVPNVVLENGTVIPGWSEYQGFNNTIFNVWEMEGGRAFSNKVSYTSAKAFVLEQFVGAAVCAENGSPYASSVAALDEAPSPLPAGVAAEDLQGLLISPIWEPDYPEFMLKVWVNKKNLELYIPNQMIMTDYYNYGGSLWDLWFINSTGVLNTLDLNLSFSSRVGLGPTANPGFGVINYVITMN